MLQKAGSRQQANGNGALIGGQVQGDADQGLACGAQIPRGPAEPSLANAARALTTSGVSSAGTSSTR